MSSIYHSMDAPFSPAEQKIDKLKPAEKAFFVLDDLCAMTLNSRSVAPSRSDVAMLCCRQLGTKIILLFYILRAIYDQYRYGWHMWEHLFGLSQYSSTGQWHNCVCALPAPLPPAPVRSLLLRCAPHTLCPWCAHRRPR